MGFPCGSVGKESACNAGDLGLIPGVGRSLGGGHGNPLQYSCLENANRQWSLVVYSPWSCKESDKTDQYTVLNVLFQTELFLLLLSYMSSLSIIN